MTGRTRARRLGRGVMAGCALLSVALAVPAAAQGPGLRVGELEIHPTVWLSGGYDSNFFLEADSGEASGPNPAGILQAGLGLALANRSPNKVGLFLESKLAYRQVLFLQEDTQGGQVRNEVIDAQNAVDYADVNLGVAFLPRSTFTVELHEDFRYSERPAYDAVDVGFKQLTNSAGVDLRFRPGERAEPESRAFETRLGYRFELQRYLEGDRVGAERAEKDGHRMQLLTRWRFLPKTALLLDTRFKIIDYRRPSDRVVTDGDEVVTVAGPDRDSKPLRIVAGVQGLVTRRVSVVLKAGYANTFNVEGDSYNGPVGVAEVQYVVEPSLKARLGYEHDGRDSSWSNFVVVDKVYGELELFFLSQFRLGLGSEFGYYRFSESGAPVFGEARETIEREDPVFASRVSFGYLPRDWLLVEASWLYEENFSDQFQADIETEGVLNLPAYSRHLVLLKTAVNY